MNALLDQKKMRMHPSESKWSHKVTGKFLKPDLDESAPDNQQKSPSPSPELRFCSRCGAPLDEGDFQYHQPTVAELESDLQDRDLVISTTVQEDKSLFVALLEETTPEANSLEQDLQRRKTVYDVSMVDGGLVVEPLLREATCSNCSNRTVCERSDNADNNPPKPHAQHLQNKLNLLKQMAGDEVTSHFESFVEGSEINTDAVKNREALKGQRNMFYGESPVKSTMEEESDNSSLTSESPDFESLYPKTTDELEIEKSDNNQQYIEALKKKGFKVYSPGDDE